MHFQQHEHIVGKRGEILGDPFEFGEPGVARNALDDRAEMGVDLAPVGRPPALSARHDALLEAGGDHLGDVPAADGDALARQPERPIGGTDVFGQALDLLGTGDERREIEAEGLIDLTPLPFAGVALAVGAVATHDEASVDQARDVTAQGRRRHAVGPERQLPVRRPHHEPVARQRSLWVEAQKRVEHRQRPLGDPEFGFGSTDRTEDLPLVDDLLGCSRLGFGLHCHMGKRQRSPSEGRSGLIGLHDAFAFIRAKKICSPSTTSRRVLKP